MAPPLARAVAVLAGVAALGVVGALDPARDYALMIDAGSTGSRVRLFSWGTRVFTTLPPPLSVPLQQEDFLIKVRPGIGVAAGRAALRNLINATHHSPQLAGDAARWADIPIYLFATAGMRVLGASAREAAFAEVRDILGASGFAFAPQQARVLAGEEEGVFGWLTANRLQGLLPGGNASTYVGALDMGGASTQITFAPTTSLLANLFHVGLESRVAADVYTHSFLYFGLDKARWRLNQLVLANTTAVGGARPHPCYLTNGTTPYGLTVNGVGEGVPFRGAGQWDACVAYVTYLLNTGTECLTDALAVDTNAPAPAVPAAAAGLPANGRLPPINAGAPSTCSVNGVYQPPLGDTIFYAFSGYTYLYQFFGLAEDAPPSALAAAGRAFCSMALAAALAAHPDEEPAFIVDYCFTAAYVHTLWTVGYGFPDDARNIRVPTGANSSAYAYAYGSMLYEANQLTWAYSGGNTPAKCDSALLREWRIAGIAGAVLVGVLAIAVVALLCCRKKPDPRPPAMHSTLNPTQFSGGAAEAWGQTL